jgi:hypothetical protein
MFPVVASSSTRSNSTFNDDDESAKFNYQVLGHEDVAVSTNTSDPVRHYIEMCKLYDVKIDPNVIISLQTRLVK